MRHEIKKSRKTEWGKLAEEQSSDRLYAKHDYGTVLANRKGKNKKTKVLKIDLRNAAFGQDSDAEMSDLELDEDDEDKALLELALKPPEEGETATTGEL